jgi:hypothetical protein
VHTLPISPLGLISALDVRSSREFKTRWSANRGSIPQPAQRLSGRISKNAAVRVPCGPPGPLLRYRAGSGTEPSGPGITSTNCSIRLTYFLLPASGISRQDRLPDLRALGVEFS